MKKIEKHLCVNEEYDRERPILCFPDFKLVSQESIRTDGTISYNVFVLGESLALLAGPWLSGVEGRGGGWEPVKHPSHPLTCLERDGEKLKRAWLDLLYMFLLMISGCGCGRG